MEEIRESGKILIAADAYFPPFQFFKGYKLTGFEVNIANAIGGHLGRTMIL